MLLIPRYVTALAFLSLLVPLAALADERAADEGELANPPQVAREFRAAWIATVANIDWPTKPGLSVEELKAELGGMLDLAAELKMNAVVLQVRPACDAIYASELEPWSEFLTGRQGLAPEEGFDPLTWACDEAHERGLELHAWFNPYRASHPAGKSEPSSDHVSNKYPDLVRTYGKYMWLDPGEEAAVQHSIDVVSDVVRRYDVDGVHFDDYFYPYPIKEEDKEVPFPDDASWAKYCDATPETDRLERNDWRRDNVNRFIKRIGEAVHEVDPQVRYGVSPFGIWRPGTPETIQGFDPYVKLYADSRLWFQEGWVDYFTPQLYWPINQTPQSFTTLLAWWQEQNSHDRHLWPGLYTSKTGFDKPLPVQEIIDQIVCAREQIGVEGHVHFSMKALSLNYHGMADRLRETYAEPALVPATPWLAGETPLPEAPTVVQAKGKADSFRIASPNGKSPRQWVIQKRCGDKWTTAIINGKMTRVTVRPDAEGVSSDRLAVSAVDRLGRQSEPTVVTLEAGVTAK